MADIQVAIPVFADVVGKTIGHAFFEGIVDKMFSVEAAYPGKGREPQESAAVLEQVDNGSRGHAVRYAKVAYGIILAKGLELAAEKKKQNKFFHAGGNFAGFPELSPIELVISLFGLMKETLHLKSEKFTPDRN